MTRQKAAMRVEWDFDDFLVRAVRGYVRRVAEELRLSGDSSYVQVERPISAYVALDGRLPGFGDRDVALLWDEVTGWSLAVETRGGEDLVARFGADAVPEPSAIARWVRRVFDGDRSAEVRFSPNGDPSADLKARLAPYADHALMPLPWSA
ncbi:DUF6292 family protein [Actinosynnema sp. NPDC023587]|uniref:DUF6292 family protein n=1 Tax=Actinosynnema sp. NPDC023587 TaxID=3154695 RepID=UPI0033DD6DAE